MSNLQQRSIKLNDTSLTYLIIFSVHISLLDPLTFLANSNFFELLDNYFLPIMYSYCPNIVKGLMIYQLKQYRVIYKTSKEESSYIGDIRPSSEEPEICSLANKVAISMAFLTPGKG